MISVHIPILHRDLRAATLSRRWQRSRRAVAQLSVWILAALLLTERWSDGFSLAPWMRAIPLTSLGAVALLVLGVQHGALLLTPDRQEGILPLLLITRLSGHRIVQNKLVQGLLLMLTALAATLPAALLPLTMIGYTGPELFLIVLGCLNVLFVSMSLGLFVSVFVNGSKAAGVCLLLLLPWLILSTPLRFLLPSGPITEWLFLGQSLNPCEPLSHVQTVIGGIRPARFWVPLLASHAVGWGALLLAGALLRPSVRWQAGRNGARRPSQTEVRQTRARLSWRTSLLNRNPYFWLSVRDRWPTVYLWMVLLIDAGLWLWITWFSSIRKGVNVTLVLVIAASSTWALCLLGSIPREAVRQFLEDRTSGSLELLLCTPLKVSELIRGQWLGLRRRFLLPLVVGELISLALAFAGYFTLGFGGMLDPEDRGLWLGVWLGVIVLFPITVIAVCWVAMRRALITRNPSEATGMAFLHVIAFPGLIVWALYLLSLWQHVDLSALTVTLLFATAFGVAPFVFVWRSRRIVLTDLRRAVAERSHER